MYKFIDLCAGAGGLAYGLVQAHFKPILLIDMDIDCCHTLFENKAFNEKIMTSTLEIVARSNCLQLEDDIDLICGGPPCQPFSIIGKKRGFDDFRSMAIESFLRIVSTVKPKMVLIENVPNLCTMNKGKDFYQLMYNLSSCGYQVCSDILNANCFNVPQDRKRLFIVGCRHDLKRTHFSFPQGINIPHSFDLRRALHNVPESQGMKYSEYKKSVMELVPEGGNWRDLPKDVATKYMKNIDTSKGGCSGLARRLSWNKASPTLLCSPCQKLSERCHPSETRPLTIREYARIQTFPDSYKFLGSITSQYKQIGNAVPVNMAKSIGLAIKSHLDFINQ